MPNMEWWVAGLIIAIAAGIWLWRRKRARKDDAPASIVLLLDQPRSLNVHVLAPLLAKVTGRTINIIDPHAELAPEDAGKPAGEFVAGESPHFIASLGGTMFAIHNCPAPYVEDPDRAGQSIPELRRRKALRDHKAWLSMDIVHPDGSTPEAYRMIGRVLAELIGPECLALYHPPTERLAPCSLDETIEALKADDPVAAVFGQNHAVPVIPIDDDPRLKAAAEEARRRFPEFEAAFRNHDGSGFSIKTPITRDGNTEHIWVEVERISGGTVEGKLGNDPVDLGDLRLGSTVEVEIGQVEDWIFMRQGGPLGGFSLPVLQRIAEERAAES